MLLLGYILYLFYYGRYLYGILAFYCFSLLYVTLLPFIFVSARLFLHFTQIGIRFLSFVSNTLRPFVDYLSSTRYIGATFEWLFRVNFFLSFCCLIISDAVLRKVVSRFVGKHSTGKHYSLVNAWSPKFEGGIFDEAMEQEQNRDPQKESESMNHESCTNSYSPAICYSLSTAAQLCYEGISIVMHELRAAGFDVDNTFHPIHYKNTYGYVCTKGKTVIVVFRGTQPLNVSNITTDLQLGMVDGSCIPGSGIGMIHRGFLDALGSTDIPPAFSHISSVPSTPITSTMHISTGHPAPTLQISMTSSSLLNVIKSTVSALWKIFSWLIVHLLHQVNHPGENLIRGINLRDLHGQSTFVQASVSIERAIRSLEKKGVKRDEIKLYITGHSLGAAIAYLFLAKLTERNSPLLPNFASLYTFGSPRVGCANFATYLGSRYPNQIFRVVHNNDIVPRVPHYHEPPGSLVFIQSSGAISVSPPYLGPKENVQAPPPPVRGIKFLHLSGVLNANVLKRMKNETLPRVVLRFCLPFFLDGKIIYYGSCADNCLHNAVLN
ncbi:Alpha/Beta hydrolase protein [Paraphysoderma sedebokerense]|nr:Alpha/Beta hydrolase protein [Paraphysoderma sedebokerense]